VFLEEGRQLVMTMLQQLQANYFLS
jgi:hypothetical protein